MSQGNLFQASIGEAIIPGSITTMAINRGSILEQINSSRSYLGKAINLAIGRFLTTGWS